MLDSHQNRRGRRGRQLNTSTRSTTGDHFGPLFRRSRDAILICDETGRWVDANPAAEALLGFARDELIQLRVSDLVTRAGSGSTVQDTGLPTDGPWHGEIEIRGKGDVNLRVDA
ncbi:MAG TPA: PAS domain-containing protein, partial [Thermomicrobiales bacterium]|nr:PAS domain-containing protein [Thermomicrobiales bacterium]